MRRIVSGLVIGLCMMIVSPMASASDRNPAADVDISAAKKKKQLRQAERPTAPLAAQRGWFDPSLGPDGKPYRSPYPLGTCSTDMGYGRFSTCDFHE